MYIVVYLHLFSILPTTATKWKTNCS